MLDTIPSEFFRFEAEMLYSRYTDLKHRDHTNFLKQLKLFSFLILYGAAPFTLEQSLSPGLLRAWGCGGLWLVITILFTCDRDFRAYGLHLKERVYCLFQLSVLRGLSLGNLAGYKGKSLLPVDGFRRRGSDSQYHGFPEYLSPGQIRAACYFFKFLGVFPVLYALIFSSAILFPGEFAVPGQGSIPSVFLLSFPVLAAWLMLSAGRCKSLQCSVFEARRISSENPWPVYSERARVLSSEVKYSKITLCSKLLLLVASVVCALFFASEVLVAGTIEINWGTAEYLLAGGTTVIWLVHFFVGDYHLTEILKVMRSEFPNSTSGSATSQLGLSMTSLEDP